LKQYVNKDSESCILMLCIIPPLTSPVYIGCCYCWYSRGESESLSVEIIY